MNDAMTMVFATLATQRYEEAILVRCFAILKDNFFHQYSHQGEKKI